MTILVELWKVDFTFPLTHLSSKFFSYYALSYRYYIIS